MVSTRRLGAPDAKNRTLLLDATEQLMVEQGYASVSSRRVAEAAGLKPQLVHYYFRTMDDLFLAVVQRAADRWLEVHALISQSSQPLRAWWHYSINPAATTLTAEFVALANNRKTLRSEIRKYVERIRVDTTAVIEDALTRYGFDPEEPDAVVLVTVMSGVGQALTMGDSIGMGTGKKQTLHFVESYLRKLEGECSGGE